MPLPGDNLIPEPDSVQTMAVTISAPPAQVWPWLVQMGVDRAGLYSYTWVTPDHYPGKRMGPRVVELESGRHLVLDSSPGAPAGTVTGTWQFILHDAGAGRTRLLLRTRTGPGRPAVLRFLDFLLQPGYLVMDRAMLLGIKQRAEREMQEGQAPAGRPLT